MKHDFNMYYYDCLVFSRVSVDFHKGAVVWARCGGTFPFWPSCIIPNELLPAEIRQPLFSSPFDDSGEGVTSEALKRKIPVYYYGRNDFDLIRPKEIKPFAENMKLYRDQNISAEMLTMFELAILQAHDALTMSVEERLQLSVRLSITDPSDTDSSPRYPDTSTPKSIKFNSEPCDFDTPSPVPQEEEEEDSTITSSRSLLPVTASIMASSAADVFFQQPSEAVSLFDSQSPNIASDIFTAPPVEAAHFEINPDKLSTIDLCEDQNSAIQSFEEPTGGISHQFEEVSDIRENSDSEVFANTASNINSFPLPSDSIVPACTEIITPENPETISASMTGEQPFPESSVQENVETYEDVSDVVGGNSSYEVFSVSAPLPVEATTADIFGFPSTHSSNPFPVVSGQEIESLFAGAESDANSSFFGTSSSIPSAPVLAVTLPTEEASGLSTLIDNGTDKDTSTLSKAAVDTEDTSTLSKATADTVTISPPTPVAVTSGPKKIKSVKIVSNDASSLFGSSSASGGSDLFGVPMTISSNLSDEARVPVPVVTRPKVTVKLGKAASTASTDSNSVSSVASSNFVAPLIPPATAPSNYVPARTPTGNVSMDSDVNSFAAASVFDSPVPSLISSSNKISVPSNNSSAAHVFAQAPISASPAIGGQKKTTASAADFFSFAAPQQAIPSVGMSGPPLPFAVPPAAPGVRPLQIPSSSLSRTTSVSQSDAQQPETPKQSSASTPQKPSSSGVRHGSSHMLQAATRLNNGIPTPHGVVRTSSTTNPDVSVAGGDGTSAMSAQSMYPTDLSTSTASSSGPIQSQISRKIHKPVSAICAFGFGGACVLSFPPINSAPPVFQSVGNRFDNPLHRLPLLGARPNPLLIRRQHTLWLRGLIAGANTDGQQAQQWQHEANRLTELLKCWKAGELLPSTTAQHAEASKLAVQFIQRMVSSPLRSLSAVQSCAVSSQQMTSDTSLLELSKRNEVLLWRTLEALLASVMRHGSAGVTSVDESLLALLTEGNSSEANEAVNAVKLPSPPAPSPASTSSIEKLLVLGKREEAVELALEQEDYALALLAASLCDMNVYQRVVRQLASKRFSPASSALQTFALLSCNQGGSAPIFQSPAVKPAAFQISDKLGSTAASTQNQSTTELLHNWRQNVALLLSTKTQDWQLLLIRLAQRLQTEARDGVLAQTVLLAADTLPFPLESSSTSVALDSDVQAFLKEQGLLHRSGCGLSVIGDVQAVGALRASEVFESILFHRFEALTTSGGGGVARSSNQGSAKSGGGLFGWFGGGGASTEASVASAKGNGQASATALQKRQAEERWASYRAFLLPLQLRFAMFLADCGLLDEAKAYVTHISSSVQQLQRLHQTVVAALPPPTSATEGNSHSNSWQSMIATKLKLSKKFLQALEEFDERLSGHHHNNNGNNNNHISSNKVNTTPSAGATSSESSRPSSWGGSFSFNVSLKDLVDGPQVNNAPASSSFNKTPSMSHNMPPPPTAAATATGKEPRDDGMDAAAASTDASPFAHVSGQPPVPSFATYNPYTAQPSPRNTNSALPLQSQSQSLSAPCPPPGPISQQARPMSVGGPPLPGGRVSSTGGYNPAANLVFGGADHALNASNTFPPTAALAGVPGGMSVPGPQLMSPTGVVPSPSVVPKPSGSANPFNVYPTAANGAAPPPHQQQQQYQQQQYQQHQPQFQQQQQHVFTPTPPPPTVHSMENMIPTPSTAPAPPPSTTSSSSSSSMAALTTSGSGSGSGTAGDDLSAPTTGLMGSIRKGIIKWIMPNAVDATENTGSKLEAYFDKQLNRWVFPGEDPQAVAPLPPPPTSIGGGGSSAGPSGGASPAFPLASTGASSGNNSGSSSSSAAPAHDPLAALMAPPSRALPGIAYNGNNNNGSEDGGGSDPLSMMMRPPPLRGLGSSGNMSTSSSSNLSGAAGAPPSKINVWKPPTPSASSSATATTVTGHSFSNVASPDVGLSLSQSPSMNDFHAASHHPYAASSQQPPPPQPLQPQQQSQTPSSAAADPFHQAFTHQSDAPQHYPPQQQSYGSSPLEHMTSTSSSSSPYAMHQPPQQHPEQTIIGRGEAAETPSVPHEHHSVQNNIQQASSASSSSSSYPGQHHMGSDHPPSTNQDYYYAENNF